MATTPNQGWTLPTVGGDENTWGTSLNANLTALDTLLGTTIAADYTKLAAITSSAAELNILDGVTATAAELNILDGVTAVFGDLNILAGAAAAGVTSTEFQYLNGVTSAIQTQLDAKAPIANPSFTGDVTISDATPLITLTDTDTSATATVGADNLGSLYLDADAGNAQASSIIFLRVDGTERLRVNSSGALGIGGANYGTSGQAIISGGSGAAPSYKSLTERVAQVALSGLSSQDFAISLGNVVTVDVGVHSLSFNSTQDLLIQLIMDGVPITSGYVAASSHGTTVSTSTAGFIVRSSVAADQLHGGGRLLFNANSSACVFSGAFHRSGVDVVSVAGGKIGSLTGTLTGIRITPSVAGTFDAGFAFVTAYRGDL